MGGGGGGLKVRTKQTEMGGRHKPALARTSTSVQVAHELRVYTTHLSKVPYWWWLSRFRTGGAHSNSALELEFRSSGAGKGDM